jgi:F-type H+-transporting ATPase subunit delta
MMANSAYAISRAQEIFKTALEKKELNRWQTDLRRIAGLARDSALLALLENPKVSSDEKVEALSGRLVEVSPGALTLVAELVAKGRLAVIDEIAEEYQKLVDNYRGVEGAEVAEVTTAIELDDKERLALAQRLTDIIGRPIVLKPKVDPNLIGGIVIRVGDKLIDGSVRSKLEALRREISRTAK